MATYLGIFDRDKGVGRYSTHLGHILRGVENFIGLVNTTSIAMLPAIGLGSHCAELGKETVLCLNTE